MSEEARETNAGPFHYALGWIPSLPDFRDVYFTAPKLLLSALPPAVDLSQPEIPEPWGEPYDQGPLGSCGPQTACADICYALLRQQGLSAAPRPSRLFIYYCTRWIMGTVNQDSGVMNRDMLKALAKFGWCDEELWPYNTSKFRERPPEACFVQAETRKLDQYQAVPQIPEQMKACIAGGDPFIFGFTVFNSIDRAQHTGVIPMPTVLDRQVGGHDVLLCGYNDGPEKWQGIPPRHAKLRNSWDGWGDRGYGYIPYEYFAPQYSGDFWTVRHGSYGPPPQPHPQPGAGRIITYKPGIFAPGEPGTYQVQ